MFKNAWFDRFARKQGVADNALIELVVRAERGLIDADLGGGVIKQRLARAGAGRSGGLRAIILYRRSERAFFFYGFAKGKVDNIGEDEEIAFKKAAAYVLRLSDKQLAELIAAGKFVEVHGHGEKISK